MINLITVVNHCFMFLRPLNNVCLLLALSTHQFTPIPTPVCSGTPCIEQAGHKPALKVELLCSCLQRTKEVRWLWAIRYGVQNQKSVVLTTSLIKKPLKPNSSLAWEEPVLHAQHMERQQRQTMGVGMQLRAIWKPCLYLNKGLERWLRLKSTYCSIHSNHIVVHHYL